ncbi:MAG TPA: acetyltransferase [Candidatus Contendobacter sp.]|nr:acetyltransferase [Candidatus Contendobacter sp.]
MSNEQRLAEAVRAACIKAALEAYEDGGILGLCAEGRWEYAISAMQQLDVAAILRTELPELPTTAISQD